MKKSDSSRRRFFGQLFSGAAATTLLPAASHAAEATAPAGMVREPARDVPLRDDADVIVCGGGPAGTAAAIAASRLGARTRLFEMHGCLGGVWTAGLLTWIFDFDKPGFARELAGELDKRGARRHKNAERFVYEPEAMKLLLEELCTKAGVKVQLFTSACAAQREGRKLTTVITESKSGREAWRAPVFIDATGDGDLGAQAGCGWDTGRPGEGVPQPLTMNAVAAVKDANALTEYISFFSDVKRHIPAVEAFKRELQRAGVETSYGHPTLFHIRDNLVLVMINHEYGVKATDAAALTAATVRARAEISRVVAALRKLGGPWEGMQVVASAEQIGIREGRRLHGRYTVTRDDLVAGARHADAVTRPTFNVDIHALTPEGNKKETISHGGFKMKPYDIPLRSLIAKDVDGLLLAGRCISGDFIAHASYRVTGNSVALGEAAGAVAAVAAQSRKLPHDITWADVAQALATLRARH
jgi:hypothetical protein